MSAGSDGPGPAWAAWANVMPVAVPGGRTGPVRIPLPLRIPPDSEGRYADVRLVDERGNETPYAIDPAPLTDARDASIVASSFVAGRGTEALFDLGRRRPPVDCVALSVDPEQHPSFFERVAVDVGNDRRHMRTVRSAATIYRVGDDDGKGDQRVTFAPTSARWLRVRVLDPRAPFPLTGASVTLAGKQPETLAPVPVAPVAAGDAATHRQIWTFAAAQPFRPSAVTFVDAAGTFVRPVRVEANEGQAWSFAGDGTIARYADGTVQTSFGFPEDTASGWRVVVENGDDAPLAQARPVLLGVPHELVFEASPQHRYRLLYGNPAAVPASYDLGIRLGHARWKAQSAWLLATQPNPAYRDPRRWWKRGAWLVGTLALATIVAFVISAAIGRRAERFRST